MVAVASPTTAMRRVRFQVVGAGPFPIDMLRSDVVAPETQIDAAAIEEAILRPDVSEGPRTITLTRWAETAWTPNELRWVSYGWQVVAGSLARADGTPIKPRGKR